MIILWFVNETPLPSKHQPINQFGTNTMGLGLNQWYSVVWKALSIRGSPEDLDFSDSNPSSCHWWSCMGHREFTM